MRLYGTGSILTPARIVLDVFLMTAGLLITSNVLLFIVLLVNPLNPIREYFHVTTIAAVPSGVWPTEGIVRVDPGIATASVDPWAYITFRPVRRSFVAATVVVNFSWWACALLMLLQLRRAFNNVSAGTPFPRDNILCIRRTGLAILGMAAVELIMVAVMLSFMRATTTIAGTPAAVPWDMLLVNFPLGTILAGIAVVILAEVFRAGADLQEDQALTV